MDQSADGFPANKLSVITFNYDRSLEHYFRTAFANTHGMDYAKATEIVDRISIIHLHGQLGKLPPSKGAGREYGPEFSKYNLDACVGNDGIKIVSEASPDTPDFIRAKDLLDAAQSVVFLGFGYDYLNMDRLGIAGLARKARQENFPRITGTAFGLSDMEKAQIQNKFHLDNHAFGHSRFDALEFLRETVPIA